MEIKKFEVFDIDEVMQLWLECNLEVHYFIDKRYWLDNYEMVKKMILNSELYVYKSENRIIGFAGLLENYIAGIFVDKNYRSKGIGKQLITYLKKRHKQLSLAVYQKNQLAIDFYLKEDFKIIKEQIEKNTKEIELIMEYNSERLL